VSGDLVPETAPAPTEIERLRGQLEQAETPAELTAVVDYAAAIADRAKRFRQALKSAKRDDTAFVDAARQVYGIEIEAAFARLEAICQIAGVLPGAGRPENSKAGLDFTAADFGISAVTAAQWKRWAQRAAALAVPALHTQWAVKPEGDPSHWETPALSRILWVRPGSVDTPPPPVGRYRTLVIDPPWPTERMIPFEEGGTSLDYPTMILEEIAALPVGEWAADGCHLYLWVTHRFLPAGLRLLEGWGARYHCVMTWRKNGGMTPRSWMFDTEHVLFARIGTLPLEQLGLSLIFDADRAGHSVKPDVFYERVIAASPEPRLEMFARREREGFTAWGAEVPV
jgi:N6-adenosine-specific RNA methylase IME4